MYTRIQFGKSLKERVLERHPLTAIGTWAFSMYWEHMEDIDLDFRDILLALNGMEYGPEFALTYEELNKIADDLIAGKDVRL